VRATIFRDALASNVHEDSNRHSDDTADRPADPHDDIATVRDDGTATVRDDGTATVRVHDDDTEHHLVVPAGTILRDALLDADLSPYTRLTERANCGGRGLCATCGVRVHDDVDPTHWHDRLAARFGYPRLSCQIRVTDDLDVSLDHEKRVWGRRR
jgi:ferredoxin